MKPEAIEKLERIVPDAVCRREDHDWPEHIVTIGPDNRLLSGIEDHLFFPEDDPDPLTEESEEVIDRCLRELEDRPNPFTMETGADRPRQDPPTRAAAFTTC